MVFDSIFSDLSNPTAELREMCRALAVELPELTFFARNEKGDHFGDEGFPWSIDEGMGLLDADTCRSRLSYS
jgi:hypothetical protein